MDDVICSSILLLCNYDVFMKLSKINKKFNKVSKIVWQKWINLHLKTCKEANHSYTYYNGKNGRRILHGIFEVNQADSKIRRRLMFRYPSVNPFNCGEFKLTYSHGKLNGKCFFNRPTKNSVIAEYKKGCLHGPMVLYFEDRVKSVRFYEYGKKCCSLKNNGCHFCRHHISEGFRLMGWDKEIN